MESTANYMDIYVWSSKLRRWKYLKYSELGTQTIKILEEKSNIGQVFGLNNQTHSIIYLQVKFFIHQRFLKLRM